MAKQNSVNLDITNNADGFSIAGGSTSRTLGVSGADITLVGSGTATLTFPTTSTTIAGLGITQTFTTLQTFSAGVTTNNIYASSGVTFASTSEHIGLATFNAGLSATSGCSFNTATVYIVNSGAVDPLYVQHNSANGLKVSTTGQARSGSIRLGNAATSTQNTFISQTDGTLTLYNGFSTTGSNMLSVSATSVNVGVTVSGLTLNALLRSTAGISALGATFNNLHVASGLTIASPIITLSNSSPIIRGSASNITLNAARPAGGIFPAGVTFRMQGWDYDTAGAAIAELLVGDATNGFGQIDVNTFSTSGAIGITGTVTLRGSLIVNSGGISAARAITGGTFMSSEGGYRVTSNAIRTLTGTTYTLLSTDDGKIITSSNSSTQIFTIPTGLPVGFNCSVIQLGTGVVGFSAAAGVTLNSFAGKTFMAGQHAAVSIIEYATNIVNISGGLTA